MCVLRDGLFITASTMQTSTKHLKKSAQFWYYWPYYNVGVHRSRDLFTAVPYKCHPYLTLLLFKWLLFGCSCGTSPTLMNFFLFNQITQEFITLTGARFLLSSIESSQMKKMQDIQQYFPRHRTSVGILPICLPT